MTSYVLAIVDVTKAGNGEGARGAEKERGEGEINKWEASRELEMKLLIELGLS